MIDFHSHFLPCIDDGSKSIEESLEMLRLSSLQGVTKIIATPHFYASLHTPQEWFKKRDKAFKSLAPYLTDAMPEIKLGAEVHYYEGMAQSQILSQLCIENTSLILVEMPHEYWTSRMKSVIIDMSASSGITVALAHIERYLSIQPADVWNEFKANGILLQTNAEFFIHRRTRRKALRMLKNGSIDLLASDCHNTADRPPCLREAAEIIAKSLGNEFLDSFFNAEAGILRDSERKISAGK